MRTIYMLFIIISVISCSRVYSKNNTSIDKIANNPEEAYFYIKQLKSYFPLLWEGKGSERFDISERTREHNDIYFFRIDKIKPNGPIAALSMIADKRGFFKLLEKAYQAPLKNVGDIGNYDDFPIEFKQKLAGALLQLKYIYYFKILKLAKENRWVILTKDLII